MKTRNLMIGLISSGLLASGVMAQTLPPAPPSGGGGPGGGPGGRNERPDGPPGPRDDNRGGGGGDRGGPGGGDRGGPGGGRGGPRDDQDSPPPMRGQGGGPGGPGGMGGPGGGRRDPLGALSEYIQLVDRYTTLASNPSAAGVSAVVSLTELMKAKGPEATIAKLNEVLPQAKDPAIQRAIRLQLIDLYKASRQDDKAIEQAVILISGAAPVATPPSNP